jgi:uncharacterized protein
MYARASETWITSNHVRGETCTFLRLRLGHRSAVRWPDDLDRSFIIRVEFVSPDSRRTIRWLQRHDERDYSFVEATSFALMKSLRIREALAFNGDFGAAGFIELRPKAAHTKGAAPRAGISSHGQRNHFWSSRSRLCSQAGCGYADTEACELTTSQPFWWSSHYSSLGHPLPKPGLRDRRNIWGLAASQTFC